MPLPVFLLVLLGAVSGHVTLTTLIQHLLFFLLLFFFVFLFIVVATTVLAGVGVATYQTIAAI